MDEEMGCFLGRIEQLIRYAVWNSGCDGIVIGISGGVDSALAAAMCCRAIPPDRVLGITMPTKVTPEEEVSDAIHLCQVLGMRHCVVPIEHIIDAHRKLPGFLETPYLIGNLAARTRMAILYYYANRDGRLVCGTSNKTEYMLGYCTKWGDNAADIQPILHLQKDEVYSLAREVGIPGPILSKEPSAGLWTGQTDEGELGMQYERIDSVLRLLESGTKEPVSDDERKVIERLKKNEHKRRPALSLLREKNR
jgi:NAD+ synthase